MNGMIDVKDSTPATAGIASAFVKTTANRNSGAIAATNSASTTSTAAQGISSNDFLTLLVTEMKNQDPTQPTDPNAYIQQLVGVNSLQQLIQINQTLTGNTASGLTTAIHSGSDA